VALAVLTALGALGVGPEGVGPDTDVCTRRLPPAGAKAVRFTTSTRLCQVLDRQPGDLLSVDT